MEEHDIYSHNRFPHKNKEHISSYDIPEDWHKNRKKGISAFMRSYNDERWIGPVIESILPFFDEICVIFTDGRDMTRRILNNFHSDKIKIYEYPFKLRSKDIRCWNSVFDVSYLSNYGLSKTIYSHVSTWDSDMIMLPKFATKKFYDYVLSKNVVHLKGYNVVTDDFKYTSKQNPFMYPSIRFIKINQHTFYECTPNDYEEWTYKGRKQLLMMDRWKTHRYVQRQMAKNILSRKDVTIRSPGYLHAKPLIMKQGIVTADKWSEHINEYYSDMKDIGDEIKEEIPECVNKKPVDYL